MLLIYNEKTNPFFNLAMEEYFLKNFDEDIFILWRNESSVIVRKNQNALSEINLDYIKENRPELIELALELFNECDTESSSHLS